MKLCICWYMQGLVSCPINLYILKWFTTRVKNAVAKLSSATICSVAKLACLCSLMKSLNNHWCNIIVTWYWICTFSYWWQIFWNRSTCLIVKYNCKVVSGCSWLKFSLSVKTQVKLYKILTWSSTLKLYLHFHFIHWP